MSDCAQNCHVTGRVEALEGQLDEYQMQNSTTHKEIFGRIGTLEKSSTASDIHYKYIIAKLDALSEKVGALESKPAKNWENLVTRVLAMIETAILGLVLLKIGLG